MEESRDVEDHFFFARRYSETSIFSYKEIEKRLDLLKVLNRSSPVGNDGNVNDGWEKSKKILENLKVS
jgi:hypothetical protein